MIPDATLHINQDPVVLIAVAISMVAAIIGIVYTILDDGAGRPDRAERIQHKQDYPTVSSPSESKQWTEVSSFNSLETASKDTSKP